MRYGDVVLFGNRIGVLTQKDGADALALSDGSTIPYYNTGQASKVADALDVVKQFKEQICKQAQ